MIGTLIINESVQPGQKGENSLKMTLGQSMDFLGRMIKPATLNVIEGKVYELKGDNIHQFLKSVYVALEENGQLYIQLSNDISLLEKAQSLTKMVGFQNINMQTLNNVC